MSVAFFGFVRQREEKQKPGTVKDRRAADLSDMWANKLARLAELVEQSNGGMTDAPA